DAYDAYRAGRLDEIYDPLVGDDTTLPTGLAEGTHALGTRLRATARLPGRVRARHTLARRAPLSRVRRRRRGVRPRRRGAAFGRRGRGPLRGRVHRARRGRSRLLLRRPDRGAGSAARAARAKPRSPRPPTRRKPALV